MAGYIFNIGKEIKVLDIIKQGYYSPLMSDSLSPNPFEGTFGDFVTMKEGDNVYFFQNRKIYGIGKLYKIGDDCKYNNFIGATSLERFSYNEIKNTLLIDFGNQSVNYRWICFFNGSPSFYEDGLDMDEVLSYKPDTFKVLRTNWKRTFIKIDDVENKSLKELFLLRIYNKSRVVELNDKIRLYSSITEEHLLNPLDLIISTKDKDRLRHEMAIESATLGKLALYADSIFGKWDYVTHQLCASPFKPIDYMDKIDIFAYKYIEAYDEKVVSKYMIIELKKDTATCETINQISNYVDYVCKNYAYGDYSLIEAYILAYDFSEDMYSQNARDSYERTFNIGAHPIKVLKWNNVKYIKYSIINNDIQYIDVTKKEN